MRRSPVRAEDRKNHLDHARSFKMARSAHAYVRGSTVLFYEWLAKQTKDHLPAGPPVWICGDCHAGNLGPVASVDGRVSIQIRDLDQTVIGNPAHDIVRLALSLATAARGSDLPGVTTARILERVIEGYIAALEGDLDAFDEAPESVKLAMKRSLSRTWKHLARDKIQDEKPTIPLGQKFWKLSKEENKQIVAMFAQPTLIQLATSLRSRDDEAKVNVMDAAYWVKGCSSLGLLRFAVLLELKSKKHRDFSLVDIKEAVKAVAPAATGVTMPVDNAERVVKGAKHLSPYLGQRMAASRILGKSVFIRELLPQDLKIEIDQLTIEEAQLSSGFLAGVIGKAHARQMDEKTRKAWATELKKNRSTNLDAPSWLWSSVVSLIGAHEQAYLEHCRTYSSETKSAA